MIFQILKSVPSWDHPQNRPGRYGVKSNSGSRPPIKAATNRAVIGAKVMHRLESIDHVAYVRYASVYRQFEDVGEFIDEIKSLDSRRLRDTTQEELFD